MSHDCTAQPQPALEADHVVFASGYRADLAAAPYLVDVLDRGR